jgi:hypothetical protein
MCFRYAFKILFISSLIVFLASCGPRLEDARKLGFSTIAEMKKAKEDGYKDKADYDQRYTKFGFDSLEEMLYLQERNYISKTDYLKVIDFSPEFYFKNCLEVNRISYAYFCRGNRISWIVVLVSVDKDWARLQVRNDDGTWVASPFEVESKSFLVQANGSAKLGDFYEVDGVIGARNFKFSNIDKVTFVRQLSN